MNSFIIGAIGGLTASRAALGRIAQVSYLGRMFYYLPSGKFFNLPSAFLTAYTYLLYQKIDQYVGQKYFQAAANSGKSYAVKILEFTAAAAAVSVIVPKFFLPVFAANMLTTLVSAVAFEQLKLLKSRYFPSVEEKNYTIKKAALDATQVAFDAAKMSVEKDGTVHKDLEEAKRKHAAAVESQGKLTESLSSADREVSRTQKESAEAESAFNKVLDELKLAKQQRALDQARAKAGDNLENPELVAAQTNLKMDLPAKEAKRKAYEEALSRRDATTKAYLAACEAKQKLELDKNSDREKIKQELAEKQAEFDRVKRSVEPNGELTLELAQAKKEFEAAEKALKRV